MAARRWLSRVGSAYAWLRPVYLGDDLYGRQPICADVLAAGGSFIFGCKLSSHKTLTECLTGVDIESFSEIVGVGSAKRIHRYRWMEGVPLKDGKDALIVNWLEIEITKLVGPNREEKITYRNNFVTDLAVTRKTVADITACGRARWKIENETFNVLKNNGYNLEHNFGHGKDTLASLLVAFNLLAFTMHNACDLSEYRWQKARGKLRARNRFFAHIWSITDYHVPVVGSAHANHRLRSPAPTGNLNAKPSPSAPLNPKPSPAKP